MILSDRGIRKALDEGRIVVEPLDQDAVQPSSLDLRVGNAFRVFANHRHPIIDVRRPIPDLTELVEVDPSGEEAFILHPGEFVLGTTHERIGLGDDLVARIEGKALAVNTPVPTPRGWRTMGDLAPGDQVFDERGSPCLVVAVSGVMENRPCREVLFSDGEAIIADVQHRWWTATKAERSGKARGGARSNVRTTAEIESTLSSGREYNHHVPVAEPVRYEAKELPVDPYVLGAWLGDGTSKNATLTCADLPILDEIRHAGYRVEPTGHDRLFLIGGSPRGRDRLTGRFTATGSLRSTLQTIGVLRDKHVPRTYLEGDVAQRLALLQGLMDTDGYVDRWGRCDFTSTNMRLAEAVVELSASLGLRPTQVEKRAKLYGVDHGPVYEVQFSAHIPVFRLPRKLARQRLGGRFHRSRGIRAVREVASVPVRCIQVASPRGVFLAGRTFIPTHNSSLGRLGLLVHATAGFVDAGFRGHLTLELSNVATLPITIYPRMRIGQLAFFQLSEAAEHPYGSAELRSKYQGQREPTASRYFENFDDSGRPR